MKRLVYSPKINAYVKTDQGVVDLSPYIVDCGINRKVNQVSTATLTFRNPNFVFTHGKYTDPDGNTTIQPVLHPMDPIIITMTRLRDRPIQVFTGYCDKTPYVQLYPGLARLEASCTLKRLQYTYWDPGLPFVWQFLGSYGWQLNPAAGGIANWKEESVNLKKINNLNDSSIGDLLFAVLQYVGGWDTSTIYIEPLPPTIGQTVAKLFDQIVATDKQAQKEFEDLLHNMIGASAQGDGSGASAGSATEGSGIWVKVGASTDIGSDPKQRANGGMSFAELLLDDSTSANRGLHKYTLAKVLGMKSDYQGMPMGSKIQVRKPGASNFITLVKSDNGSGQGGDPHYKIDLHEEAANALNIHGLGDVECRSIPKPKPAGTTTGPDHTTAPAAGDPGHARAGN